MTKNFRVSIGRVAMMALGLFASAPVSAEVTERAAHPVRKLGLGLANALGGVMEIPVAIHAVGRTLIGVLELATFPIPFGDRGYEPLIRPEFVLEPEIWEPPPSTSSSTDFPSIDSSPVRW